METKPSRWKRKWKRRAKTGNGLETKGQNWKRAGNGNNTSWKRGTPFCPLLVSKQIAPEACQQGATARPSPARGGEGG